MKRNFGSVENRKRAVKYLRSNQKISAFICVHLWLIFLCSAATAQTLAPGAPGKDAQWATAGKQAVGTSANLESKVWFTLADGVMTEVYYPDVTTANVHKLEIIIADYDRGTLETESEDTISQIISEKSSLSFTQINTAKSGEYKIIKKYTVDPRNNVVLLKIQFLGQLKSREKLYQLYVYYDPSLNNSGMHNTAWTKNRMLLAQDGDKSSALISDDFEESTNGFLGISDGLTEMKSKAAPLSALSNYQRAENGNVVQVVRLTSPAIEKEYCCKPYTLALGFGKSVDEASNAAQKSLKRGFDEIEKENKKGWEDYVKTLPKVGEKYQAQFNMAAMQLKAHEDKTIRGANIASLSVPWGGGENANENTIGGYHLVWSRDLYQVATAYLALGDTAAANRALDFVFNVQQKPDGSVPQNSKLDGTPYWGSLQHDEVAFPLILAYQLKRFDRKTWENHVKKAADFIVKTGPRTPQERWEEEAGYSPSTIAAEIAGLVCAAEIAKRNNDETSANLYLKTADEWQANVEKWTATKTGKYGDGNYYLRITGNGKPDAGEKIELNNGAGFFDERKIVDAGFLELVRLGIKSPTDPLIQKSLKVIDRIISVKTPNGAAFYRYNHDGYGEMDDGRRWNFDDKYTGKGRLWALLSGERGQFELAFAGAKCKVQSAKCVEFSAAQNRLNSMLGFANDGLMIPEQIWDLPETPKNIDRQFVPELKFGEGTGSATPLAWSMAQFIRLAVNLQAGKNLDTPDVVYNRYVLGKKNGELELTQSQGILSNSININKNKDLPARTDSLNLLSANVSGCETTKNYASELGAFNSAEIGKKSPIIFPLSNKSASPLVFTYSGVSQNAELVGDFTGWKSCGLKLVGNSDLKIYFLELPNSARVEYKFIVDGKWITDPLNPNKVDNGVGGENSFFAMPDYKPTEWNITVGQSKYDINFEKINSKIYGEREIQVYVPEDFSNQNLPVLYLQDGTDYQKRADAVTIQRNLVKANKLKPFVMVFIDYKDRTKEYWANDDYAKYVATEIVPVIDAKYKTIKSPDGRAIMGASLGGITSVYAGVKYPEIFGRVGGQSSSWWIDNERVVKEMERLDSSKTKLKFYLDDGTLEGVEDSRKAVGILKAKGYNVTYVEGEAGHNWTAWRDRLADAFIALWK